MKILSLTLTGYRQFLTKTTLAVPTGLTGICGPNGVGKSKLIEAIGFALYGPNSHLLPSGDRASDIPSRAQEGSQPAVELVLEIRGQQYRLNRTAKTATLHLEGVADALAQSVSGVTQKMIELLRLPPAAYHATFVARQNELAHLQNLSPIQRRKLVNRLIGVAVVEKALELIEGVYVQRQDVAKREADKLQTTVDEAERELQERRLALEEAEAKEADLLIVLKQTTAMKTRALERWNALQQRLDTIATLERDQQFESKRRASLVQTLASTQTRLAEAEDAGVGVEQADQLLRDTDEVPARLERMQLLARVSELREQQARHSSQLSSEVQPIVQQYLVLETAIADHDARIQELKAQIAEIRQKLALASQVAEREHREAERHERQEAAARQLGASGACETCGQSFGDNLAQALSHYRSAADAARGREREAQVEAKRFETQLEEVQAQFKQREAKCQRDKQALSEAKPALEQQAQIERDLAAIQRELATFPEPLLEAAYDPAVHQALIADQKRREQTLRTRDLLRAKAATAPREQAEERRLIDELTQLDEQVARRQQEIITLQVQPGEQTEATTERDTATSQAEVATVAHSEAGRQTAAARALVNDAETRLQATSVQAQRLAEAERAQWLAERTREALRQLLGEIIAEARPRIAELLELWARPILGPRFRRIELTEDYLIRADNGSGMHNIEHFSGGEQTLLALILRVAISLFCQERAGFDTGFLILDEIFGNQDSHRRAQLVQFLTEIKEHYHQIIIVNHIEDVTGMLDSIITVEPTGANTSTATLAR